MVSTAFLWSFVCMFISPQAPIRLSPKEIIDRNIFVGLPSKHGHILFAATTSDLLAFFRLFCHCFHARVGLLFAPQLFPTDQ